MAGDRTNSNVAKSIGRSLVAAGVSAPIIFSLRGAVRARRLRKLISAGMLGSRAEVDAAVARHMAETGKSLPKYEWADSVYKGIGGNYGLGGPVPVYQDGNIIRKHILSNSSLADRLKVIMSPVFNGPHYNPAMSYVSLGNKGELNPYVLMHELGHAEDVARHGRNVVIKSLLSKPRDLKQVLRYIAHPDDSHLVRMESRAWDNAGLGKGNPIREAALDTYRNQVQSNAVSYFSLPTILTGSIANGYGNSIQKKQKSNEARTKNIKSILALL